MIIRTYLFLLILSILFSSLKIEASNLSERENISDWRVKAHKDIENLLQERTPDFAFILALASAYGFIENVKLLVEEKKLIT